MAGWVPFSYALLFILSECICGSTGIIVVLVCVCNFSMWFFFHLVSQFNFCRKCSILHLDTFGLSWQFKSLVVLMHYFVSFIESWAQVAKFFSTSIGQPSSRQSCCHHRKKNFLKIQEPPVLRIVIICASFKKRVRYLIHRMWRYFLS